MRLLKALLSFSLLSLVFRMMQSFFKKHSRPVCSDTTIPWPASSRLQQHYHRLVRLVHHPCGMAWGRYPYYASAGLGRLTQSCQACRRSGGWSTRNRSSCVEEFEFVPLTNVSRCCYGNRLECVKKPIDLLKHKALDKGGVVKYSECNGA